MGGHRVDAGELAACAETFEDTGTELTQLSVSVRSDIGTGHVGQAWPEAASRYQDAVERFQTVIASYGRVVTQFGGQLSNVAKDYAERDAAAEHSFKSRGI